MKSILPIVIAAVLATGFAPQGTDYVLVNGTHCPLPGDATTTVGKALNRQKNRTTYPTNAQIDPNVTLESILVPGDDVDRFDSTKAAEITVYVLKVDTSNTPETCNCHATEPKDQDTHME